MFWFKFFFLKRKTVFIVIKVQTVATSEYGAACGSVWMIIELLQQSCLSNWLLPHLLEFLFEFNQLLVLSLRKYLNGLESCLVGISRHLSWYNRQRLDFLRCIVCSNNHSSFSVRLDNLRRCGLLLLFLLLVLIWGRVSMFGSWGLDGGLSSRSRSWEVDRFIDIVAYCPFSYILLFPI